MSQISSKAFVSLLQATDADSGYWERDTLPSRPNTSAKSSLPCAIAPTKKQTGFSKSGKLSGKYSLKRTVGPSPESAKVMHCAQKTY